MIGKLGIHDHGVVQIGLGSLFGIWAGKGFSDS